MSHGAIQIQQLDKISAAHNDFEAQGMLKDSLLFFIIIISFLPSNEPLNRPPPMLTQISGSPGIQRSPTPTNNEGDADALLLWPVFA